MKETACFQRVYIKPQKRGIAPDLSAVCLSDVIILPGLSEKTVTFALTVFKYLQNKK